jgi:hypothetical protein
MITKITQSFVVAARDYFAGQECGLLLKHQYVDGKLVGRKSKSLALGSYFEWLLSGALPKDGKVPMPVYMKTPLKKKLAKDLTIDDMTEPYRRAHFNAAAIKDIWQEMGLEIVRVGHKYEKGNQEGTIDLVMKCTKYIEFADGTVWREGDFIVLDIKYSGLLYDRWERYGWAWSELQKEYHGTQAKQYGYITGLPFYFWVVSNTNKMEDGEDEYPMPDIKLFRVPLDEFMIEQHLMEGNKLLERFKFESTVGFVARPSLVRCSKCPLVDTCESKHLFPHPETVDLTIE